MPPAGTSELQKLFAAALVAFALGVAGNVITFFLLNRDRHIRDLERETKRLAYWKAVRELKADDSGELGLSQTQITALNRRLKEDVQKSIDVTMGWHGNANTWAVGAAWLATMLLANLAAPLPFFDLARRGGISPDTPEYWVTKFFSMLGYCLALWAVVYRSTYKVVYRMTLNFLRK